MAYYLDLFSPQTFEAFRKSNQDVSGFRTRQRKAAQRIAPGDKLICYLTKLSRWVGLLDVLDGPYEDSEPIFVPEDDPFIVRFKVRPEVLLDVEHGVPIHETEIWDSLSFTRNHDPSSNTWTGKLRGSLVQIEDADGSLLERVIAKQASSEATKYPVDLEAYRKLLPVTVRRADKDVVVSVPADQDSGEDENSAVNGTEPRESHRIQALIADLGTRMGMEVWIPRSDRGAVDGVRQKQSTALLDRLPLNYDDATLGTIENIDVLWLRGRAIARAFEVEHTTSIYSGILRMADLLALQPNMDINLHIVGPVDRREKVFQEIRRPVFSLLDGKPLSERCTFISYDSLRELAQERLLEHMTDSVLDEYAEEAE